MGAVPFENPESRLLLQHNQESVLKIVRGLGRVQACNYSSTSAHKRLSKTESSKTHGHCKTCLHQGDLRGSNNGVYVGR